jgi:hypothetical protein
MVIDPTIVKNHHSAELFANRSEDVSNISPAPRAHCRYEKDAPKCPGAVSLVSTFDHSSASLATFSAHLHTDVESSVERNVVWCGSATLDEVYEYSASASPIVDTSQKQKSPHLRGLETAYHPEYPSRNPEKHLMGYWEDSHTRLSVGYLILLLHRCVAVG